MATRTSLEAQCRMIGWGLSSVSATKTGKGTWSFQETDNLHAEEVVARAVSAAGGNCSWCEGGSINLLLKAAALPVLSSRNPYNRREDAIRRFLEAQLTILSAHGPELVDCSATISATELRNNIFEICADTAIKRYYPRVNADFLCGLADVISVELRSRMLQTYLLKPYDYRAGWPDLTVLNNDGLSFIEVKTTDLFHKSQLQFAHEVATILDLNCSVVQVVPIA